MAEAKAESAETERSSKRAPALVGGAVIAALAGGIAIARNGSRKGKGLSLPFVGGKRRRIALPHISLPHLHKSDDDAKGGLRATAKALGGTAVEIGKAGYRVGELTSEIRRVREQAAHKGN